MGKNNLLFNPLVVGSAAMEASATMSVESTAAITVENGGVLSAGLTADIPFAPKVLTLDITTSTLSAASTVQSATFASTIPAHAQVIGCFVNVGTVIGSGGVSAVNLSVGPSGDTDGYVKKMAIGSGGGTGYRAPTSAPALLKWGGITVASAATTVKAIMTATGANVSAAEKGSLSVYVTYIETAIGAAVP